MLIKILIFRTDRIGDLIFTCPTIISIKKYFEECDITLITSNKNYDYAKSLNQFNNIQNCIAAGHIHVGGYINWDTAKSATEESIRTLLNYLDSFIYTPGDLNQDTIIDILDLVIVINFILGDMHLSNIQEYAADINEDAIINIQDVIMIINMILN